MSKIGPIMVPVTVGKTFAVTVTVAVTVSGGTALSRIVTKLVIGFVSFTYFGR